ncbi:unnamed protein product, partial [Medioppia subpectinata]
MARKWVSFPPIMSVSLAVVTQRLHFQQIIINIICIVIYNVLYKVTIVLSLFSIQVNRE